MLRFVLLVLVLVVATTRANTSSFYGKENGNDVVTFDSLQDFEDKVLMSPSIWMVVFDQDETKNPNASKIAEMMVALETLMKGIFPVGFIDLSSDAGQQIFIRYSLKQFPVAMVLAGEDKTQPASTYDKTRWHIQDLSEMLLRAAEKIIEERSRKLDGKFTSQQQQQQQQQSWSTGGGGSSSSSSKGPSKVVQLTSDNFDEYVYENPLVVMVAFTAPWCGHCQRLQPDWEDAAKRLDGQGAILGWVDATVEKSLASQYNIEGFPTIKLFPGGAPKSGDDAKHYSGERTASSIVKAVLEEVDRTGVPPDVPQLLSQDMLLEQCAGHNHICVLAALPHILDSTADGRNKYRDVLRKVSKTFRGTSGAFSFLWFEGTSQPELEQALELTFGFPAIVAFSFDRKAYAVMRGAFTEKVITTFLHRITSGRQPTIPLPSQAIPKVLTVEEWDGLDGEIVEEEMSLDEIMGWDDDEDEEEEEEEEDNKKEDGSDEEGDSNEQKDEL